MATPTGRAHWLINIHERRGNDHEEVIPRRMMLSAVVRHWTRRLVASNSNTATTSFWNEVVNDQSHKHARHILHSGLRLLKGDVDTLKKNVQDRGLQVNVDELVRSP